MSVVSTQVQLPKDELERLSKEELIAKWKEQESYVEYLESQAGSSAASNQELVSLRESEEKLKQQQLEATRRENVLVMRLTTKEQEMQDLTRNVSISHRFYIDLEHANDVLVQHCVFGGFVSSFFSVGKKTRVPKHQIQALKGGGSAGWTQQLRAAMLDPAVNLLFERMRHEVDSMRSRLEETQNELSAWKFTPDRRNRAAGSHYTMTSPQYELNDLMELADICGQARENSGLAAAAASPTNVGRESTYNIPIPPTNVGVPNPAHLTNTPAHVG
ncbi:hypothetical protein HPB49_013775 [Dermacentor silvarum]|uniref:Uncharacterized protein n=1 Tax=Dermacentor silvarum TaxID=543639 RepID=A0ACB8C9T5_DERSI|nr:hypothetical protein HPB49_013775 [Dermacentor silvarum]